MGKPLIMVSSITYAMKSKEILSRRGFKVYVERVPHTSEAVGCGYGAVSYTHLRNGFVRTVKLHTEPFHL